MTIRKKTIKFAAWPVCMEDLDISCNVTVKTNKWKGVNLI